MLPGMRLAALQAALAARFPSALSTPKYVAPEMVSTGVAAVDALTGGLPRGSLVEICGARCSGRTSLLTAMLAACHARGEVCALVDGRDSFDPRRARAAGVVLERTLWVRCSSIEQTLRSAELILTGGGFGLVALDLAEIPVPTVRRIPLHMWFRFRRAVEHTPAVLVVLQQQPQASSCASLVLELRAEPSRWRGATAKAAGPDTAHTYLLTEKQVHAEVVRSRYGNFVKRPVSIAQNERDESRIARFAIAPRFG